MLLLFCILEIFIRLINLVFINLNLNQNKSKVMQSCLIHTKQLSEQNYYRTDCNIKSILICDKHNPAFVNHIATPRRGKTNYDDNFDGGDYAERIPKSGKPRRPKSAFKGGDDDDF